MKPAIFIISAQNAALNLRSAVNNSLSSPMRHTHLYVLNSTFLPWIEGSSFGESKCFHFEIVHAISQIDKRYKGMWASVSHHWSDVEKWGVSKNKNVLPLFWTNILNWLTFTDHQLLTNQLEPLFLLKDWISNLFIVFQFSSFIHHGELKSWTYKVLLEIACEKMIFDQSN